jgi:hypothetical protein
LAKTLTTAAASAGGIDRRSDLARRHDDLGKPARGFAQLAAPAIDLTRRSDQV